MSFTRSSASLYHSLATVANPSSCTSEIMADEKISPYFVEPEIDTLCNYKTSKDYKKARCVEIRTHFYL
jgi:hypothetical protein